MLCGCGPWDDDTYMNQTGQVSRPCESINPNEFGTVDPLFPFLFFFARWILSPAKEKVQTDPSPPPWPPFVDSSGAHICIHRKTRGLGSVVGLTLVDTLPRDQSILPGSPEYFGRVEAGLLYGVQSGLFLCFCIFGLTWMIHDPPAQLDRSGK